MSRTRLDITNYEEWFIDHLDGTLNEQEEDHLQAFLLANPQLSEELEAMDHVQLEADELSYPQKSELLVPNSEELKLLYLAEKGSLAALQNLSASEREVVQSLRRTILQPDLSINYPGRAELLQEESTPIIPMWLSRVAIAASVIGAVSLVFFNSTDTTYIPREPIALEIQESVDDILTADYKEFAPLLEKESEKKVMWTPSAPETKSSSDKNSLAEEVEIENPAPPILEPEEYFAIDEDSVQYDLKQELNPLFTEVVNPSVEKTIPDEEEINESMASMDVSTQSGESNPTKEYNSMFSFLKAQVIKTAEEKELLAMDDVSEEDAYIKTSFRLGGFEISRSKRRK